jgi:hypothetical protein
MNVFSIWVISVEERLWQYLMGAVWIVLALVWAGLGVLENDLWLASAHAVLSIATTLLGAAFLWHDRFTVFQ